MAGGGACFTALWRKHGGRSGVEVISFLVFEPGELVVDPLAACHKTEYNQGRRTQTFLRAS